MNEEAKDYLSQAMQAYASGQYAVSQELCDKVIALNPEATEAYALAGSCCLVREMFFAAEKYFRSSVSLDPENGERYFELANSLFGQQRNAEAMEAYATALQYGCRDDVMRKIHYIVGLLNQFSGNQQEALDNYAQSEAYPGSNEDLIDILLQRTQIYVNQNDMENAEKCALQVKLLRPGEFRSYQLLFQIYLERKKLDEAAAVLDEAQRFCGEQNTDRIEIGFDKAMLFCCRAEQDEESQGKFYSEALRVLSDLQKNEALEPQELCEAKLTSAEINIKLGNYAEARSTAEQAAKMREEAGDDNADRACYILVRCGKTLEDYALANRYLQPLKESENLFYRHYGHYMEANLSGLIPEKQEDAELIRQRAIAYFRNCTAANAVDFMAYVFRAYIYADSGKYDKALKLMELLPPDSQHFILDYINQVRGEEEK